MGHYEKPVITRLQSSHMNKFGLTTVGRPRFRAEIDGASIESMIKKYGSPLFVYSERTIRRRIRQYYSAFSTRYPDVVMAWSYKTNYLKAICSIMHDEGAWAEVVSQMEYEKAKSLGIPGDQIVFNGPHKPFKVLSQAVYDGALINLDHFEEIDDLSAIAKKAGIPVKVGIRINLDAGIFPQWSRFGFNLENGQAFEAVRRIAKDGLLQLNGLHCHIGTFILDAAAYARQVEKMVAFALNVEYNFGFRVEYLDLGGGFPSRSTLKGSYLSPDVLLPSVDDFAERICDTLLRCLPLDRRPRLILESGRAMVDESGHLVTSVISAKRLADGTRAYVVDAGVNLLYTATWYKFHIETVQDCCGLTEPSVVYGPLCMNIDVVDDGLQLPPLERGQQLVLSPVGAYNNTQWMQFIEYRPNCLLVGPDGVVHLIREAEDLSEVERLERLPEHLRRGTNGAKVDHREPVRVAKSTNGRGALARPRTK